MPMIDRPMARILIVEDERDTQQMLFQFMKSQGYDVVCADNGWEALLAVGDFQFDLILLDIMMPGLDGAKFLQILRKASKAGSTPVLIVTALDRDVAQDRIGNAAVDGIVVKRERLFEDLLGKVKGLIGPGKPAATPGGGGAAN